jgi:hypothetical protein
MRGQHSPLERASWIGIAENHGRAIGNPCPLPEPAFITIPNKIVFAKILQEGRVAFSNSPNVYVISNDLH